jgi:hypothetical protein
MTEKALIFDSGTLINLAMNGLLYMLEDLKKGFKGKFLITKPVFYEVVEHPAAIARFELGALQIKSLIDRGIIELSNSIGISDIELEKETATLTDIANHYLQANGSWIKIVSEGEMSCLALSDELSKKGIENIIAIDERTTRLLAEKPENLERIMSERLHKRVLLVAKDFQIFSKYKFIRSSEIVYVSYKKGLSKIQGPKALEALLFATKFKGAAISFEEIEEIKKL